MRLSGLARFLKKSGYIQCPCCDENLPFRRWVSYQAKTPPECTESDLHQILSKTPKPNEVLPESTVCTHPSNKFYWVKFPGLSVQGPMCYRCVVLQYLTPPDNNCTVVEINWSDQKLMRRIDDVFQYYDHQHQSTLEQIKATLL